MFGKRDNGCGVNHHKIYIYSDSCDRTNGIHQLPTCKLRNFDRRKKTFVFQECVVLTWNCLFLSTYIKYKCLKIGTYLRRILFLCMWRNFAGWRSCSFVINIRFIIVTQPQKSKQKNTIKATNNIFFSWRLGFEVRFRLLLVGSLFYVETF